MQESVFPYIKYKRHNIQVEKSSVGLVKIKKIRDPKNQVTREGNLPDYAVCLETLIAEKAVWRSVFLPIYMYTLNADSTKLYSSKLLFSEILGKFSRFHV